MTALDPRKLQKAVGANQDGILGLGTYTALFRKCEASDDRAQELAVAANRWMPDYGMLDNTLRLSHFLGQLMHESGSFRYMEEIWGPTPAQKGYEGRADLGNTEPGDGFRYKGHGPLQITGRANHRYFGRKIGIDLERHPEIAALPSIGLHLALEYWADRKLNALADADDIEAITRKINGGTNGLADRQSRVAMVKGWLA